MIIVEIKAAGGPGDPDAQKVGLIHIWNVSDYSGPMADYAYSVSESNKETGVSRQCTGHVKHHARRQGVTDLIRAVLADVDSKEWLST